MKLGTKSVLFGAHCFFFHPLFLARAWWKLYGFPWDPRLWFAFFLHDIGYIGKSAMDDAEGETHPELGARIMGRLFDTRGVSCANCFKYYAGQPGDWPICIPCQAKRTRWHDLCLYHSRHYAKHAGKPFSRLCVADKLVFAIEPKWLYLFRVRLTGEIVEYLDNAKYGRGEVVNTSPSEWHDTLKAHMLRWVEAHKDGHADHWTVDRHQTA